MSDSGDMLKKLLARCKCGVYLTVNEHLDYYMTAESRLEELDCLDCPPEIEPDVRTEIIKRNALVCIIFFPDTPIGSYDIYHYDLDEALKEALECPGMQE